MKSSSKSNAPKLRLGDNVVTAFAERVCGPAWSNLPVWVIVRDSDGNLRQECLQQDDLSAECLYLLDVSNAAHVAMTGAVCRVMEDK